MRKLAILVVILLLFGLGFYLFNSKPKTPEIKIEQETSRPNPTNATFLFDGEPLTLKNGSASITITPGSALTQETELTGEIEYGDINGDKKNDAAVLLLQSGGGTGMFLYVAAYVSGNVQYKGSNAVFIGDRVSPKSIAIVNNLIKVEYLDRKPDEPFAAEPTVLMSKTYIYRNSTLEER